jgi:hypothetical protein
MCFVLTVRMLFRLYAQPDISQTQRLMLMRMIYGAQSDAHDYHKVGFDFDLLASLLGQTGFCNVTRVSSFQLHFVDETGQEFEDSSDLIYMQHRISLNVVAKICPSSKPSLSYDGFNIEALQATPYTGSFVG